MRNSILIYIFLIMTVVGNLFASGKTNTFRYLYSMAQTAHLSLVQIESQKRILERRPDSTNLARFRQSFLLLETQERAVGQSAAAKMDAYVKKHPSPVRFIQRKGVTNYRILTMQTDSVEFNKAGHFILNVNTAYAVEKEFHGNLQYMYRDSQRKKIGPDFGYPNTVGRTSCFLFFEITEYLAQMAFVEFYK